MDTVYRIIICKNDGVIKQKNIKMSQYYYRL